MHFCREYIVKNKNNGWNCKILADPPEHVAKKKVKGNRKSGIPCANHASHASEIRRLKHSLLIKKGNHNYHLKHYSGINKNIVKLYKTFF